MIQENILEKINKYANNFNTNGWVSIPNFLDKNIAESVYELCNKREQWSIATIKQGKPYIVDIEEFKELPAQLKHQFINEVLISASKEGDFQYMYEYIRLLGEGAQDEAEFKFIKNFLLEPTYKDILGKVIGSEVKDVDAKVTKYTAGYFLKEHNDVREQKDEKRIAAYVLGLTKDWKADFGGLLNIMDDNHDVIKTIVPKFNTLTIFKVPKPHFVSQVANYCPKSRFSITGWLWSESELNNE